MKKKTNNKPLWSSSSSTMKPSAAAAVEGFSLPFFPLLFQEKFTVSWIWFFLFFGFYFLGLDIWFLGLIFLVFDFLGLGICSRFYFFNNWFSGLWADDGCRVSLSLDMVILGCRCEKGIHWAWLWCKTEWFTTFMRKISC